MARKQGSPYALVKKFRDGWYYRRGSSSSYPWVGPFETQHVAEKVRESVTGGAWGYPRTHSTKKRPSQGRVVSKHGLGTADVRTGEGAYWIVERPKGYRVDYKPWGPSNEIDLGTFPSRRRAHEKIAEHALSLGAIIS